VIQMSKSVHRFKHIRVTQIDFICEDENPVFELMVEQPEAFLKTYSSAFTEFPRFIQEKEDIVKCIKELKESFGDPEDRQIFYAKLRTLLGGLRDKVALDRRTFLRLINMLVDTLENTKSELINVNQVETLDFVMRQMSERMEEIEVNQLQEILFNAGFKPIPKIEGIPLEYE